MTWASPRFLTDLASDFLIDLANSSGRPVDDEVVDLPPVPMTPFTTQLRTATKVFVVGFPMGFDPFTAPGPVDVLAELLDVPTPAEWGNDARLWVRGEIERLDAKRVYEFIQPLAGGGSPGLDERVNRALASEDIDIEMIDRPFPPGGCSRRARRAQRGRRAGIPASRTVLSGAPAVGTKPIGR